MGKDDRAVAAVAVPPTTPLDAVIVGAGFAGMYMLHHLRGLGFTAKVVETGSGVGGTWFWNRYPGARCDVESMEYSYQFSDELQQQWSWSERYAAQPEILRYANAVAERFDLKRDIIFETRVTGAHFDEATGRWAITTRANDGSEGRLDTRFCILATGCLSSTNLPRFEGLEGFKGAWYHTGNWPQQGVDFRGKRVGVIGTGSSAVQSIPLIAAEAAHLTVFQRTANYVVPAHNGPLASDVQSAVKSEYHALRARAKAMPNGIDWPVADVKALDVAADERQRVYEQRWQRGGLSFAGAFRDLLLDTSANDTAAAFIHAKIREAVRDPAVADLLTPRTVMGCKRLCIDTGYYETFNRPNVTLVDVSKTAIDAIAPDGVVIDGTTTALDIIVFATGFDAMTGAITKIDIRGRNGRTLVDKWSAGPRTFLGLATEGFPNLFTITGPGSPSVLTNMLPSIEHHVEWIGGCMANMRASGQLTIEPQLAAEDAWVGKVNEIADRTLFPSCNSWYLGANVPGKARVFMPYIGFPAYIEACKAVVDGGYTGFAFA